MQKVQSQKLSFWDWKFVSLEMKCGRIWYLLNNALIQTAQLHLIESLSFHFIKMIKCNFIVFSKNYLTNKHNQTLFELMPPFPDMKISVQFQTIQNHKESANNKKPMLL